MQDAATKERLKDRKGKGKAKEDVEAELITGDHDEDVRSDPSCSASLLLMARGTPLLSQLS